MATFWVGGDGANSDYNTSRQNDCGHAVGSAEWISSRAASGSGILSELDRLSGEDTNGLWMASAAVLCTINDTRPSL